ncbi:NmrA family NAD(P)-binding protein [Rathayibacter sp. VKM Ac-2856]|uniref:SDR family oxidoreductase n=1 Tax=unclassified Rathayibacter TaxID=2609250 RepID=UPI0015634025|nr:MULTISPECIES: NmrA family NAD(P)-binding protein [unclassified Rathayibacter]NQX03300.1 NmrA family NAD(P)-binding protein [Rathayibacter sp. VKM Ac-2858]NQX18468.1 NmrA family NAD(P)-binding protein [Rathayibacter sp. VKM Ac-2856]
MTFLLLGGAGRTGSRILERLVARDRPVRLASRSTGFDWDDRSTWPQPLSDARAVYVCFSPDLAFPGVPERMAELGRLAASTGVERLVLLSGRGEEGARASEAALREGGLPVAVLRCSWFQQNFSEHFLTGPVRRGRLALPAPDVPEAFVDLEDVADAAVAALLRAEPAAGTWELSGPELLTFTDIARILQEEIGAPVEFAQVAVPEFVDDLASDGVPPEEAEPLARLFTEILDGRNASLASGVEALLGRAASPFRAYARRTAATGVWR